jgi:hypothetical protein
MSYDSRNAIRVFPVPGHLSVDPMGRYSRVERLIQSDFSEIERKDILHAVTSRPQTKSRSEFNITVQPSFMPITVDVLPAASLLAKPRSIDSI